MQAMQNAIIAAKLRARTGIDSLGILAHNSLARRLKERCYQSIPIQYAAAPAYQELAQKWLRMLYFAIEIVRRLHR